MEARGLGAAGPRTWSRVARLTGADALLLGVALVAVTAAVAAAVATGAWNPILVGRA
jgi:energy-coupling factor transport system permease protein